MISKSVVSRKLLINFCLLSLLLFSAFSLETSFAQEQVSSFRKLRNCKEHAAQKDQVAVYEAPSISSEVLEYLEAGERVCVVGQRGDFYILDWNNQDKINGRRTQSSKSSVSVAYTKKETVALVVDREDDLYERAKTQMDLMRGGLVPEDVYGPFGPLIDMVHPKTKCRAGAEVCKRVEELQQDVEQQKADCKDKSKKNCSVK